jgi:hypothetical protein
LTPAQKVRVVLQSHRADQQCDIKTCDSKQVRGVNIHKVVSRLTDGKRKSANFCFPMRVDDEQGKLVFHPSSYELDGVLENILVVEDMVHIYYSVTDDRYLAETT